ncbi:NitT/TauT family transport system substrate-binding protein [Methylobacterium brachiatum]|uniref:NitT/TauT family transport system substrate-binding protein n=1 Tax=Methylobacterium brachiatum TaxID=269660 RepID=A0AAJ1TXU9_9HYPH|nr:ABC transporter substrate-binding protein [Methylobacterium brachiatum]MCB4805576.1 ABC transporter substrate-binding protein [Methylobacterium brachiatum]MDQ0546774.1 NitT/TauT family transport system substrate-binding protein [Methylobacterium brachiatum]
MPIRLAAVSVRLLIAVLMLPVVGGAVRAETTSVRIGLQYGLVYLPVMIAQSEGLFDKRAKAAGLDGLSVTLTRFSGSTAMNDALLSDSVELGTLGAAGALIAWDKTRGRQQIKSLTALSSVVYTLFTGKPGVAALKDFTFGDKVAVPAFNSPQAILLRVAAAQQLGDPARADTLMVSLPHPDATAAMRAGQGIAGYFSTPPFTQVLRADPKLRAIMTSTGLIGDGDPTAATLNAKQGFVEANPKVAQAILAGMEDAVALIRSDPKRAASIYLASEQVQIDRAQVETILTDGSIIYDVAPKGMVNLAKAMAAQGFLRKLPTDWQEIFFPALKDRDGS